MATKKTVKKAPAVVRATPETQEVRTDGEYNKYPKYHGCIRFDDDHIVEVNIINDKIEVLYNGGNPFTVAADMLINLSKSSTGLSSDLHRRWGAAYFKNVSYIGSSFLILDSTISLENPYALAFAKSVTQAGAIIVNGSIKPKVDLWLKEKPTAAMFNFSSQNSGPQNMKVYCAFDTASASEISAWGLTGATFNYNVEWPDEATFMERYS